MQKRKIHFVLKLPRTDHCLVPSLSIHPLVPNFFFGFSFFGFLNSLFFAFNLRPLINCSFCSFCFFFSSSFWVCNWFRGLRCPGLRVVCGCQSPNAPFDAFLQLEQSIPDLVCVTTTGKPHKDTPHWCVRGLESLHPSIGLTSSQVLVGKHPPPQQYPPTHPEVTTPS